MHDGGILRNRRRKGIVYAEQLAEVVRDGESEIAARLAEAQIGLPKYRPEREESKRDDDRDSIICLFYHNNLRFDIFSVSYTLTHPRFYDKLNLILDYRKIWGIYVYQACNGREVFTHERFL